MTCTKYGTPIDYDHPHNTPIRRHDVLHHLTMARRYGGAIDVNTLQHTYLRLVIGRMLNCSPLQMATLAIHDMTDAYLPEVPIGLKGMPCMTGFRGLEREWERRIYDWAGVPFEACEWKHIDRYAAAGEMLLYAHPLADVQLSACGMSGGMGPRHMALTGHGLCIKGDVLKSILVANKHTAISAIESAIRAYNPGFAWDI